jgi:hypothetical protein
MINYQFVISESGQTIYDEASLRKGSLYMPTDVLSTELATALIGVNLSGLELSTRSKIVKSRICEALAYPIPKSFRKTQPRFTAQDFDIYIQKSMNVQIYNEGVDYNRRYVFIHVDADDIITHVKIINGDQLANLDRTGKLTAKYKARLVSFGASQLLSNSDTYKVSEWCCDEINLTHVDPNTPPFDGGLLSIAEVFRRLRALEGKTFPHLVYLRKRNRGAALHEAVCRQLGFSSYEDDGIYPNIMNQLIEIKLQTSPTIDLRLHSPDDEEPLFKIDGQTFASMDIRYAIMEGEVSNGFVLIHHVYLINGRDFSSCFPLFGGKVQNMKLQIHLPADFFNY